jgi:uncharacterized protein (TIRG00374 family)
VLAFFLVLHYLLLPQLAGAEKSISVLSGINPLLVVAAVAAEAASLAASAQLTRALLAGSHRPGFTAILRLQIATLGMSHAVPGGGATATPLGFRLLRRAGVSRPDAGFVLGAQAAGSMAALNVILWIALIVSIPIRGADSAYVGVAIAGAAAMGGFGLLMFGVSRGSRRANRLIEIVAGRLRFVDPDALGDFLQDVARRYRTLVGDRRSMARIVGWATLQWLADAASLWLFLAAVGVYLEPDALLIAFGLANLSAIIPLTPGGVGVYEAVLTSSLVGFGVPGAQALLGVLAYRLFAFWLPIPLGAAAYLWAMADDPAAGAPVDAIHSAYRASSSHAEGPREWAHRRGLRRPRRPG